MRREVATQVNVGREPRRRPRIMLGLVEIAGYYDGMHEAFREVGVDTVPIDLGRHPFQYRHEGRDDPSVIRLVRRVRDRRPPSGASRVAVFLWRLAWGPARILLFVWAVQRFDAFVFSTGQSFFRGRDLPLLRLLGKRLIFVFHGSEARPAYIDGQKMTPTRALSIPECIAVARRQKAMIRRIERHAHVIVAQPAFSHFFERPVVNWFAIGVPWKDPAPSSGGPSTAAPIRILHSPSDPAVKGSDQIRDAVARLRFEGLDLELVELNRVPNDEVLRQLSTCDFAVDQLYSDAPMVGFATEAAVASKATIVGGYAWAANRAAFGAVPFPPVEECEPEDVAEAIRRLAADDIGRRALGDRASRFVREHWSRREIAGRMLRLIEGGPPPREWMFDPRTLRYVEGCGLSREEARDVVRRVLAEGGREALCLVDKPELEEAFVQFAAARGSPAIG